MRRNIGTHDRPHFVEMDDKQYKNFLRVLAQMCYEQEQLKKRITVKIKKNA